MDDKTQIFNTLKNLLQNYSPPLTLKTDGESYFHLWSIKDLVIVGRKRKDIYFAGLIIQKNFVGFYYMPIYVHAELKNVFPPELLKLLKGKSCFHVKKLDDTLLEQIRAALKTGFEFYRNNGWV